MYVKWLDQPMQVYRTGSGYLGEAAQAHTRTPAGHPEGYLEAFANIYRNFAKTVQNRVAGEPADEKYADFPTVHDGVRGMKFIDAVIASGENNAAWTKIE
jgi:predicted dehydrogenase